MDTLGALLNEGTAALRTISPTPRLDAEVLLTAVTGHPRLRLVAEPEMAVAASEASRYRTLVERRRQHEPVAYLIGLKEFYGLDFEVTPAVLIPRPETEHVVEVALASVPRGRVRVLDLGTGSGCIAVALAHALRSRGDDVVGVALDRSGAALDVARRNIARHGLSDVMTTRESLWFASVSADERFDLIVSNPPYIAPGDTAISPAVHFEPPTALYAAEEGLADLVTILSEAPRFLASGGAVICECGATQRAPLIAALAAPLEFFADLAGLDRVVRRRG